MPWKPEYGKKRTTNRQRNPDWKPRWWKPFVEFFSRVDGDDAGGALTNDELILKNWVMDDLNGDIEFTTTQFHVWVPNRDQHRTTRLLDELGSTYEIEGQYHEWLGNCCYIWGTLDNRR